MRIETKSFAFEVKSVGDDGSTFEGLASVYHNIDGGRNIIAAGAYAKHLAGFQLDGKVRDEHTVTTGKVTAATDTKQGLFIAGKISDTTSGKDQKILLKDGVLTRLSIGHVVLGREWLESPEEVKSYWAANGYQPSETDLVRSGSPYGVRLVTEARPVEVSTTFMPLNERAQITSVKSGGQPAGLTFDDHSDHTLAVLEEYHERATKLLEKRSADGRSLSPRHVAAFERLSANMADLLEAAVECKGAVAFAAAPVVDDEWDAEGAKKRLKDWANGDMTKYRKGFAWFDSAKAHDFGSYKLPHHDVKDGKLVTVKRGVEAAMGALDGARGGTEIPEGDRGKVRAHLARHYAQWGGKPPKDGGNKSAGPIDSSDLFAEFQATLAVLHGAKL